MLELPNRATLEAAHDLDRDTRDTSGPDPADGGAQRVITVIGVHLDGELGDVAGWGECAALNNPGYTAEWAEGAFDLLRSGRSFDRRSAPMATAGIKMALLDAELKAAGQSLGERLGTAGSTAPAGAVVGLGTIPSTLEQVAGLVEDGYRRVKLKIAPGRIFEPVGAVRDRFPDLELQVDANASLTRDDLAALLKLADLGVQVIEQPFAVDDFDSARRLIDVAGVEVAADEAITSLDDVDTLAQAGAATAVVVKPSKLGGIGHALQLLDRVAEIGLRATIGGMLETGLGRHVLAAMAALPVFTIVGDLSPARRWLADDPFRDIVMRNGVIEVPTRRGIAGAPVGDRLDRYTIRKALVTADAALEAARSTPST